MTVFPFTPGAAPPELSPGLLLWREAGEAELLLAPRDAAGAPAGPAWHLATLEASLPLALLPGDASLAPVLLPVAAGSAALLTLTEALARPGGLVALEAWVATLSAAAAAPAGDTPRAVDGPAVTLAPGERIAAPRGRLLWLGTPQGWQALTDRAPRLWPGEAATLPLRDSAALQQAGALAAALAGWQDEVTAALAAALAANGAAREAGWRAAIDRHDRLRRAGAAAFRAPAAAATPEQAVLQGLAALPPAERLAEARQRAERLGLGARPVTLSQQPGESAETLLLPAATALRRQAPPAAPEAERALALTPPAAPGLAAALARPGRLLARLCAGPARPEARAALGWGLAGVALGVLPPVAIDLLFGHVWPGMDRASHGLLMLALAAAALGSAGFEAARQLRDHRLLALGLDRLEAAVWLALTRVAGPVGDEPAGACAARMEALARLRVMLAGQPARLLLDLLAMLLALGLMAFYGGVLALAGLAALLLLVLPGLLLARLGLAARRAVEQHHAEQAGLMAQAISAIVKVKATASEPFILARWASIGARRLAALRRAEAVETATVLAALLAGGLATGLVFLLGARSAAVPGGLALGDFLAFQAALGQGVAAGQSLAALAGAWPGMAAAGHQAAGLLPPEGDATTIPAGTAPAGTPHRLRGALAASQVSFRYPGGGPPALDRVTLAVPEGAHVALAGASGSGKSTLLRLLLGLERPQEGAVYVDGLDLALLDAAAIRRQVGFVGQEMRLAPGSILENILDGREAALDAAWEAARLAGLANEVDALPMGMHTLVGEAGQNLSGGQRQRLLIARAVLQRPRLLVFDEATSALDNRTQAGVRRLLAELPVTRLVVAHRLSSLVDADVVHVLERGRIVESGPPAALLAAGGAFARLARRQQGELQDLEGETG
ncbi:ATP-binding cassette domain-containing protein [Roseomonas sp. 18066]|uniref:ATP-binding cassette domain-containing protein n=1 Tax=Roseomonas sp. 18066 TaxID=2681412 RepID=UPI001358BBB7|nr:ATP-binding cassette domain-containing protein [Roseomonas sp. 18066]